MQRLAYWVATFFGSGRVAFAPGTAGSFNSLVLWVPAALFLNSFWYMGLLVILFFLGWLSSFLCLPMFSGEKDPKAIVIDEVVGMGIALFWVPISVLKVLVCFALFRCFDILKPWPISTLERAFPNAFGIMIDDVAAGMMAWITMQALLFLV